MGVTSGIARVQARKQATEAGVPVSALSIQLVVDCPPDALDCKDPCSLDPSSCEDPCSINPSDPSCGTDPCEIDPSDPACQPPPQDSGVTPIELPPPSLIVNQTLDSEFSILRAGIRTRSSTRLDGANPCSIGAIARSSTYGAVFLTASHCTYDQGSVTGARDFFQAYMSRPQFAGVEVFDPPYVTPSGCSWWYSTGSACYLRRNSDAALVQIQNRSSEIGTIARPAERKREGQGRGSLSINPSRPKLQIVATSTSTVARGTRLDKIGATSGWTSGTVQTVCVTAYQTYPNKRQLTCQNTANYLNEHGDSGGPVFYVEDEAQGRVYLMGIHHMRNGTYSPLAQINRDIPGLVYH
jgi:hypothetical protein